MRMHLCYQLCYARVNIFRGIPAALIIQSMHHVERKTHSQLIKPSFLCQHITGLFPGQLTLCVVICHLIHMWVVHLFLPRRLI